MLYTLNYSVLEREVYVNYTSIKLKEKTEVNNYKKTKQFTKLKDRPYTSLFLEK